MISSLVIRHILLMEVELSAADKALILELLTQLRAGMAAPPAKAAAAPRPPHMSDEEWRKQRRREARGEEKAMAATRKAHEALLAEALRAEKAGAAKEAKARNAAKGGSVRVTLCCAERLSERKIVVLRRAEGVAELLQVARAKLKMKQAVVARLLEDGSVVCSTAELEDGCVVAVGSKGLSDAEGGKSEEKRGKSEEKRGESEEKREEGSEEKRGGESRKMGCGEVQSAAEERSEAGGKEEMEAAGEAVSEDEVGAGEGSEASGEGADEARGGGAEGEGKAAAATKEEADPALPCVLRDAAAARAEQTRLERHTPPAAMAAARERLPMWAAREAVLAKLEAHAALVLSGDAGCGKSTQLPQLILEQYVSSGRGAGVAIVVVQPRRVSAISLAHRVAEERGERVGGTVGYAVRGEKRTGPLTRILFCTTGWLLRHLAGAAPSSPRLRDEVQLQGLHSLSHVIVDEVHERNMLCDFLLILLRDTLAADGSAAVPKVVCMSATINTALFADYLAAGIGEEVPVVHVPGRTFPVSAFYLEDALELVYRSPPRAKRETAAEIDYSLIAALCAHILHRGEAPPRLGGGGGGEGKGRGKGRGPASLREEAESGSGGTHEARAADPRDESWRVRGKGRGKGGRGGGVRGASSSRPMASTATFPPPPSLPSPPPSPPPPSLPSPPPPSLPSPPSAQPASLRSSAAPSGGAHEVEEGGAILIFLPGVAEIERCCAELRSMRSSSPLLVVPLHGSLPPSEQRLAFATPPRGTRKVVVATNVAETSVTIADVTHVIDTGAAKQMRWDATTRLSSLRTEWISAASATQRRGRAGRVRAGTCFHLWPAATKLLPEELPEISHAPLEELLLQASLLGASSPGAFLSRALQPPPAKSIASSLQNLVALQALEATQGQTFSLTPLGQTLASLPLDPRLGKMLVLACLCGCLPPILTVAAVLSASRSVVASSREKQEESAEARRKAFGSMRSDFLAAAAAYSGWIDARSEGHRSERSYCEALSLSLPSLREVDGLRRQLKSQLAAAGLAVDEPSEERRGAAGNSWLSGVDEAVARGVICAALYPNLAKAARTRSKSGMYERLSLGDGVQAWMHPSSINSNQTAESGLYVYLEKVETTRLFLRETTRIPPNALVLFGATPAELDVERVKQTGRVDLAAGVRVRISPEGALLFKLLRRELDKLLVRLKRVPQGRDDDGTRVKTAHEQAVIHAVRTLMGRS